MPKDAHQKSCLIVSLGQASSAGRKPANQDFFGALMPSGPTLALKGMAFAVADGISTSDVSQIAAETSVKSLMTDYYATPDSWSVKTAATRVIASTNSWLYAQSRFAGTDEIDRGYVSTFAGMILKARKAHLFHIGDSRIWRVSGRSLEPLTSDHRTAGLLSRAMGAAESVEIEYRVVDLQVGDTFLLTTDGVHDHWLLQTVTDLAMGANLDDAAQQILNAALAAGSTDNLTLQIVRIEALPEDDTEIGGDIIHLPLPPLPNPGAVIDGYRIIRELHGNHRSHIFLASSDDETWALKIPSAETTTDPDAMRRFVMEEWIARRIDNPHVLGGPDAHEERSSLYSVAEFIDGMTLRQWMHDTPHPSLEDVRSIIEQVIRGLRAFHRREMLHQDLRPENIMISRDGTVKIIDFGSVYIAGVQEAHPNPQEEGITGTFQYTAPEYFSNEPVSWRADLFSLGVITYEMLTGHLPYGTQVGHVRTPRDRRRLSYRNAQSKESGVPNWLDTALARAVHPDPARRYDALSEFASDLRRPSLEYRRRHHRPLAEQDPVRFWKTTTGLLALLSLGLLFALFQ